MPGPGRPRQYRNSREATRLRVARHRESRKHQNVDPASIGPSLRFQTQLLAHDPRIFRPSPEATADNLGPLDELRDALDAIPIEREPSARRPRSRHFASDQPQSDDTVPLPNQDYEIQVELQSHHPQSSSLIGNTNCRINHAIDEKTTDEIEQDFNDNIDDPFEDNNIEDNHFNNAITGDDGTKDRESQEYSQNTTSPLPEPHQRDHTPPTRSVPADGLAVPTIGVVNLDMEPSPVHLAEALVDQLTRPYACDGAHVLSMSPSSSNGPLPLSSLIQWTCPDVLSNPMIAQYPTTWDEQLSPTERRRLWTGLATGTVDDPPPSADDHPKVDLEHDTISDEGSLQTYLDIDSAGGFASSLAAARAGLQWKAGRAAVSNLRSSLHLAKIAVQWNDPDTQQTRNGQQPIHQVPHLPLGNLVGFPEVEIYVLFPRLYQPYREHWVITTDEYTLWTDQIFLPALHVTYPASTLARLPSSASHIALNATAARVEDQVKTNIHIPRAQDFHYTLSPSGLLQLWNEVLKRITQDGLQQFQHCRLLLTAKNLKLATQRRTWQEARDAFFSRWNRAIDVTYLQEDFYDLAKEMISSRSSTMQAPSPKPSLTMTWRRCCLEGLAQRFTCLNARLTDISSSSSSSSSPTPSSRSTRRHCMSPIASTNDAAHDASSSGEYSDFHDDSTNTDDENGSNWSSSGDEGDGSHESSERDEDSDDGSPLLSSRPSTILIHHEFYPQSGLRDQGSLTLEPSSKSALWKHGLRYSQHYNTSKEIFAAGKQYPFQSAQLDTLAVDPAMIRTWQHVGGAVSHSPLAVLQAYLHTKRRCHVGLEGCRHRSYGTREEYRVTGSLLVAIDKLFCQRELATTPLPSPPDHRPFFTYPTGLMLDWFRWNINKLCLGFEMTYSLHPRTMVHWEHTRVMMMFLKCLRLSYGGQGYHLRHSNGLWLDRRAQPPAEGSDTERIEEGIGIGDRLQATGYMWFADKIDWFNMTFRSPHRAHMIFNTPTLQSTYHERYWRVIETKGDFLLFHDIFAYLQQHHGDFRRTALLLQLLISLCLQLFRKDVFHVLVQRKSSRQPLRDCVLTDACAGKVPLARNGLRRVFCDGIFHDDIHFVSGPQMAVTHIDVLFARLWGWDGDGQQGDWPRQCWEYKTYRVLYRQCFGIIAQIHGMQQARQWRTRLRHTWIRTHWILPYPDNTTFWPRRADKRLQTWASIHPPLQAYYQQRGTSVVTPADVEFLPVTGWQRGSEPNTLSVDLPPIPSDLDAYLATVDDSVSVASSDIPLPASGIRDGPIRRFLQEQAPSQRVLRSAMQEQSLSEKKLHRDDNWLTQHLQDHLRAIVRSWQGEVTQHQPSAMARQWQQRSRPELRHSLAQLQVTVAQIEEDDSDPDGYPTAQKERTDKLQRMRRRLRLVNAEVQRLTKFNNRLAKTEWIAQLKRRPMSDKAWEKELKIFRDVRDRRRISKKRLARLSQQALHVDVDPGIL